MKKKLVILLLLLMLASTVTAYTEIEYSYDNVTFHYLTKTNNNSILIESIGETDGIQQNTDYYFRLRHVYQNGTSSWIYAYYRTEDSTKNMIIAAIILLPLILSGLLAFAASKLDDEEHPALKIFLFNLSIVPFFASMHAGLLSVVEFYDFPELQNFIGSTTYWVGLIFVVIIAYWVFYMIYKGSRYLMEKKEKEMNYGS